MTAYVPCVEALPATRSWRLDDWLDRLSQTCPGSQTPCATASPQWVKSAMRSSSVRRTSDQSRMPATTASKSPPRIRGYSSMNYAQNSPHWFPDMPAVRFRRIISDRSRRVEAESAIGLHRNRLSMELRGGAAMNEMARILPAIGRATQAAEQLLPLVYDELRRLAARSSARGAGSDAPGDGPGARGVSAAGRRDPDRQWDGRGHFFAAAAEAMRRILVEAARRKSRQKRGGGLRRVDLADRPPPTRTTTSWPSTKP